jgi:hypothetical protein
VWAAYLHRNTTLLHFILLCERPTFTGTLHSCTLYYCVSNLPSQEHYTPALYTVWATYLHRNTTLLHFILCERPTFTGTQHSCTLYCVSGLPSQEHYTPALYTVWVTYLHRNTTLLHFILCELPTFTETLHSCTLYCVSDLPSQEQRQWYTSALSLDSGVQTQSYGSFWASQQDHPSSPGSIFQSLLTTSHFEPGRTRAVSTENINSLTIFVAQRTIQPYSNNYSLCLQMWLM